MSLTLNQIRNRIETIAKAHKQVRDFKKGLVSDQQNEHTTKYPAVFLIENNGGSISISNRVTVINYQMFILDLVNVSENSKLNENDVISDMVSIAQDLIAQMHNDIYTDWRVGSDNNLDIVVEDEADMRAGCVVNFSITTTYTLNICAVPSTLTNIVPTDPNDMKLVYDTVYTATGNEGNTISPAIILGKMILFITRENNPLYKVSNSPDSSEFTWDNTNILLGAQTNPGERFLILYRNY